MEKRVLAKCLLTYPNEDDMCDYAKGKIKEPKDVRIYFKGKKYPIILSNYDNRYFEPIEPLIYLP